MGIGKTVEFFALNTNVSRNAMLAAKDFTAAQKGYLQWGSTWQSHQESNAYPSELTSLVLKLEDL